MLRVYDALLAHSLHSEGLVELALRGDKRHLPERTLAEDAVGLNLGTGREV